MSSSLPLSSYSKDMPAMPMSGQESGDVVYFER